VYALPEPTTPLLILVYAWMTSGGRTIGTTPYAKVQRRLPRYVKGDPRLGG
jgi:hypothetical protein